MSDAERLQIEATNQMLAEFTNKKIEVAPESIGPSLDPSNLPRIRIVELLRKLHPNDSFHDIPLLDLIAACRFYELPDIYNAVEIIADVFFTINQAISEQQEKALKSTSNKQPWLQ